MKRRTSFDHPSWEVLLYVMLSLLLAYLVIKG